MKMAAVVDQLDGLGDLRLVEARPASARLELRGSVEQLGAAGGARVRAVVVAVDVLAAPRPLGSCLPQDAIPLRCQQLAPFLIGALDLRHGSTVPTAGRQTLWSWRTGCSRASRRCSATQISCAAAARDGTASATTKLASTSARCRSVRTRSTTTPAPTRRVSPGSARSSAAAEPDPTQFDPTSRYYDRDVRPRRSPVGLGHRGAQT